MKIVVAPEVAADLERLRQFLIDESPEAAARAGALLETAMLSLEDFPGRGRPTGVADVRELIVPFGNSAYVLRYGHLADADTVVILRVWHGREERR